ncbi:MAG: transposase, partial [Cyanobacteria bacterium J06636_16]
GRVAGKARVVFAALKVNETQVWAKRRRLWGHWLYVSALRLEDQSLLVVVSAHDRRNAIADYAQRWGIETLFGIFKTRGFCLESTHLRDPERLSKLFALLTLALCWALRTGLWLHQLKPLTIKKHGRRAKSLFRYGFDHLRSILLNSSEKTPEFEAVLPFLSCT